MKVTISTADAATMQGILARVISAPTMLATRTITPSYDEVMALIKLFNAISDAKSK